MTLLPQKRVLSSINLPSVIYAIPVLFVILLGITSLYFPFGPDQASIFTGALSIRDGGQLYVDYWDNKQPGLFWFYAIAGWLFGYSEFGVHSLELICLVVLSLTLVWFLRSQLHVKMLAALAPLACVASYYASATELELAQLEMLVSLPIMLGIICLVKAYETAINISLLWFLSGIMAGVLVAFKLLLGAVFIVLWLWCIWVDCRTRITWQNTISLRLLPAGLGALVVILPLCLWFYTQGTLSQFIWTSFVYPPLALQSSPAASYTRLVTALFFFTEFTLLWTPFVAYAVFKFIKGVRDKFIGLVIAWLCIAILLFLVQKFSWYHYHTLLFFVPVGLLGLIGLDLLVKDVFRNFTNTQINIAVMLFIFCAASSVFSPLIQRTELLLHHYFIGNQGVKGYQNDVSDMFQRQWLSAQFLKEPSTIQGPIYVLGNPMIYQYSGREIPHPIVGSAWEFYLPEQIDHIRSTLISKQVPYLFVGVEDYKVFRLNLSLKSLIDEHYRLISVDSAGRWYLNNVYQ
ncbi:hypothetical protein [Aliiglaciecola litoralis]|uniref:Glycosyltransferase RgtA/B/C/D-like domain-containing protein n=1 Tax=Aliiglaciecola litoralis TaxID=582857 RepID=A0ABN1LEI6_9ALTE